MNWLAHLYLSETQPEFRIGNLLPDFLPIGELAQFSSEIQRGIAQHRKIDEFTDAHPIVRNCISRMPPPHRRFGGVLLDIFFDHFLARNWALYSSKSLPDFANEVYVSFDKIQEALPSRVLFNLRRMQEHDLLCSYQEIAGVSLALQRIALRLKRPTELEKSISMLEQNYDDYASSFRVFFPELQRHVATPG
jgi:acyl carrier protein phosphodiesterase